MGANDFGGIPNAENVKVVREVNHAAVFPACCAVVHHGGAGTTAAGLRAGTPTLILWNGLDQPMWATAIEYLEVGFGRRFSDSTLDSLTADLHSDPRSAIRRAGPHGRDANDHTCRKPHQGSRFTRRRRPPGD